MRLSMENLLDDDEEMPFPELEPAYHLRKPITPYLCSTPDDFSEERNFLVEKVFPEVHEFCQLRGGNFFPVDIRWNSGDDQVCTGNMLRLCLDYICKCSPFMICMLGESYGPYRPVDWPKLPEKFKVLSEEADWKDLNYMMAAAAGYSWVLKETHQNTSLTELEIIQATFLNENKHCYFYFRQPEHLDVKFGDLSLEIRNELSRVHLPENEYADLNIRDLKQRIVKKAMPVKYFQTLEELGRHVLMDWSAVIDIVYPPLEKPLAFYESEEYKDWVSNAMFADSRCQVFINSPELRSLMEEMTLFANSALNELDMEEEERIIEKPYSITNLLRKRKSVKAKYKSVMVLHGDRGSGKSTVVANWLQKYKQDNREVKVIHHYVGCSGRSKDISVFLRKVIKELRHEFSEDPANVGITDQNQPWSFQEVCQAFIAALSLGPTLIVLDGVDELGATLGITNRQIKEFKWLPFPLPPQCRLIFTTCRSDLSYHSMSLRHDAQLVTMPVFDSEKIRISYIEEVMDIHYDNLTPSNKQQVLDIKLSTKPIFLSLLAVEMQAYSVYTDLTDYLDDIYEKVSSLRDLCTKCFHRWTQDLSWTKESLYGEMEEEGNIDLEGWIPDTLRIMAISRTGLTVGDIFLILKELGYRNTREVKMFDWLQFRETIGNFIYDQPSGLLQFGHQHLQEIVEYILLSGSAEKGRSRHKKSLTLNSLKPGGSEVVTADNPEKEWKGQKRRFHGILAQYFSKQPLSQRVIEELPWHLLMSGDITQLLELLVNPRYIEYFLDDSKLNQSNKLDLAFYWSVLKESGHSIVGKYEGLLQDLDIMERRWTPVYPSVVETEHEDSLHSQCSPIPVQDSPRETTLVIPKIITSGPRQRELSAVTEESNVYTPEGDQNGEEVSDMTQENVDDNINEDDNDEDDVNTIFLTESESKSMEQGEETVKTETRRGSGPSSSSPREVGSVATPTVNPVKIAWLLAQFLKDLGHIECSERILQSLNNYLMKVIQAHQPFILLSEIVREGHSINVPENVDFSIQLGIELDRTLRNFPLEHEDMLTLAKVQEALGKYSSERGDTEMTEKFFRKSLQTVMDLYEMEETSPLYTDLQNVKGRLLAHHGYLRLSEGMVDSAEDLLREGLECATDCGNITIKATILYNLGLLRMQQEDFVLAESFLRQALSLRERWYGKSHPLVANVLFHIAGIMGNSYNSRGFNRVRSENVYRKALKIREDCLGKDNITVSDTLFELGKLLQEEYNHAAKNEAVKLLRRALDIRTTKLGGDHIDTRAVRQYLSNLEISLKMGKYEFGPAKPTDTRTMDRPFSNLSWREKDLANLARKSKSREGSKSGSLIRSRPSSYKSDLIGQSMSRYSSVSHLSASEKMMMESDRPRLLSREYTADRKLKVSPPASEVSSSRRQVTVEIKVDGDETDRGMEEIQSRLADHQIDSFGDEISVTDQMQPTAGPEVKRTQFVESVEKVPLRLFNRYNSAGSSRSSASRQLPDKSRLNSARSYGSSRITGFSYYSKSSVRTNQSKRSVHSPHAITTGNTRSVTVGPNSDLDSLVEKASPRDISKTVHHRSAWYHVPGRYSTPDKPYPPKRSQKTTEAKDLERLIPSHKYTPGYYIMRKPPSSKSRHANHKMTSENKISHNIHPFGMTVKSIGPVISNGYYGNNPNDYIVNGDLDIEPGNHNTTVKFKEAVVVD